VGFGLAARERIARLNTARRQPTEQQTRADDRPSVHLTCLALWSCRITLGLRGSVLHRGKMWPKEGEEATLSLEEALDIAGWPRALLSLDKQPRILNDEQDLLDSIVMGSHIDDICVLPHGLVEIGQEAALPAKLMMAARAAENPRTFLGMLEEELLQEMRGRLYVTDDQSRDEFELKKSRDGTVLDTMLDKCKALASEDEKASVYVGELRRKNKYRHLLDGRWVKTLLDQDIKDWLGKQRSEALPYWDRYDEGIFVGGRFVGSPMHVDQVHWSNVGKNFCGYKLLVIWRYGEPARSLFDDHNYKLFVPPLAADEVAALESAHKVALLGPGDIVVFSGGNAHMALSVSQLSVTAYESFINFNPRNVEAFLDSGTERQYRQCRTRQSMLEDIKGDVAESVADMLADVADGILVDPLVQEASVAAVELLRRDAVIGPKLGEAPAKMPISVKMPVSGSGASTSGKESERCVGEIAAAGVCSVPPSVSAGGEAAGGAREGVGREIGESVAPKRPRIGAG